MAQNNDKRTYNGVWRVFDIFIITSVTVWSLIKAFVVSTYTKTRVTCESPGNTTIKKSY